MFLLNMKTPTLTASSALLFVHREKQSTSFSLFVLSAQCREYKKSEQCPIHYMCSCPITLQDNVVQFQFIKIHSFAIKNSMYYSSYKRGILKSASDLFTIKY